MLSEDVFSVVRLLTTLPRPFVCLVNMRLVPFCGVIPPPFPFF